MTMMGEGIRNEQSKQSPYMTMMDEGIRKNDRQATLRIAQEQTKGLDHV